MPKPKVLIDHVASNWEVDHFDTNDYIQMVWSPPLYIIARTAVSQMTPSIPGFGQSIADTWRTRVFALRNSKKKWKRVGHTKRSMVSSGSCTGVIFHINNNATDREAGLWATCEISFYEYLQDISNPKAHVKLDRDEWIQLDEATTQKELGIK